VIKFNEAKKKRSRQKSQEKANQNRIYFGRTKAEKANERRTRQMMDQDHDAHRLDNDKED
tara:strand:- start:355 stop:534 length:180 start_codon:yes stop_codon:yes gene_type:complete